MNIILYNLTAYSKRFRLGVQNLRDPKIRNFTNSTFSIEEDIFCFKIPVKDFLGMDMLQGDNDLYK